MYVCFTCLVCFVLSLKIDICARTFQIRIFVFGGVSTIINILIRLFTSQSSCFSGFGKIVLGNYLKVQAVAFTHE